jgi:hypothetical protein|tara:strand:- start:30208 stop:30462 length:255 start_codon:yes stop_codon:yes gene_type:complete
MEYFYYAIITFCLKSCSTVDDLTKYVYYEPLHLEECLLMTETMTKAVRDENPRIRTRPVNSLCVKVDTLPDDRIKMYTPWGDPV